MGISQIQRPNCSSVDRTSTGSAAVPRTHVPYFRYFGPTAIVPGFKQMVRLLLGVLECCDELQAERYRWFNFEVRERGISLCLLVSFHPTASP